MSNLLNDLSSLFSFLITQLSSISSFFTSTLLGQIILGLAIFNLIVVLIVKFFRK